MSRPVIITCAVTGGYPDIPKHTPYAPVTPEEIANECIAAAKAGAAVVHIHVRDLQDKSEAMDIVLYRDVVGRIRSSDTDVIINLTMGPGAFFVPSAENPQIAAPGSSLASPESRVAHVLELKPEICSIDVVTFNHGDKVFMNTVDHVETMTSLIASVGTKPELEAFDLGNLLHAIDLVKRGQVAGPGLFQFCLGVKWGMRHVLSVRKNGRFNVVKGVDQVAVSQDFPITRSLDEVLDDPTIDAVSIATPHTLHAEQIRRAAEAKKNILTEKPFALSVAEAKANLKITQENQVVLAIGHDQRFYPSVAKLRALIAEEALGQLNRAFADMDRALGAQGWITSDTFGIADIALLSYIDRLERLGFAGLWADRSTVGDWLARMQSRPIYDMAVRSKISDDLAQSTRLGGEKHWPQLDDRWTNHRRTSA